VGELFPLPRSRPSAASIPEAAVPQGDRGTARPGTARPGTARPGPFGDVTAVRGDIAVTATTGR